MIHLVTGGIGQGKTTRLIAIHRTHASGDGFACRKVFTSGRYIGQEIARLSTGESMPFTFREEFKPAAWDEACRYGGYSFSAAGFAYAEEIARQIVHRGIEPMFVDEIGPLELEGRGFHDVFRSLLATGWDIYAVVRESCLQETISVFGLINPVIIEV